ncbi:hypothetical protein HYS48_02710 [Candidatus Woesearchaeota archaeon]|nr:hypothetical protein [Candidatus Woesearchaeota archaeon]
MRKKISICIEENILKDVEHELEQGLFRSRSHVIEFALQGYIKSRKGQGKEEQGDEIYATR